tara:strand:+ start:6865 stop:7839 length:975 start_codon:yes stop_codon:yes gene_type:complete
MKVKDLNATIKEARPNVKETTIKMYESNLNKLKKLFDTEDWDFLKNVSEVKDKLKELHYTSQRNYYNSIIILLMALNHDKKYDKLLEAYNTLRDDLNKQYEDENAKGTISEKQKANFVSLDEVKKMIAKMEVDLKGWKKKELKQSEQMLLVVYMIYQIHIVLPLRNDLSGCSAIRKTEYNKLTAKDKEDNNYLVVNKSDMFFVLNKFKTSSKYEELKFSVPKELEKLLRAYVKKTGMGVLFKSSTGKAYSRNSISQLLLKTSQKYMNKSISTTMLRKIVLSDKFSDTKKEMEAMAKITGHSTDTMTKIYVKDTKDNQKAEETEK